MDIQHCSLDVHTDRKCRLFELRSPRIPTGAGRSIREGKHPFELRSPRIPTGAGRSIREGKRKPWERTEARMGVRLLGRAILGRLVVAAVNYDFAGTD